jgi:hypothetical protein
VSAIAGKKKLFTESDVRRTQEMIMPRGPQIFRKSDVTRAIKATKAAGEDVARVEIGPDGRIIVIMGKAVAPPTAARTDPALERWLADED